MPKSKAKSYDPGRYAAILSSLLSQWRSSVNPLHDHDLVAAFVLCALALRQPSRYIACMLHTPIVDLNEEKHLDKLSEPLSKFPGLIDVLGYEFLQRKIFGNSSSTPTCSSSSSSSASPDVRLRLLSVAAVFNRSHVPLYTVCVVFAMHTRINDSLCLLLAPSGASLRESTRRTNS